MIRATYSSANCITLELHALDPLRVRSSESSLPNGRMVQPQVMETGGRRSMPPPL